MKIKASVCLGKIDTVILCGGEGKRLRPVVKDRPKPMAFVNGRPFLDILLDYLAGFGLRRFILSVGYKKNFIIDYYAYQNRPYEVIFAEEKKPLGTGGGIKNAELLVKSPNFFAMNGDSFCKVDFNALYNFHLNKKAVASVVVTPGRQDTDYGVIKVDSKRKIIAFNEKDKNPKRFYLNAGMYIFQRKIFNLMPPAGSFSIERDFFPEIVDNKFYAYVTREGFIDIGTPVRYRGAQKFLKKQGESKA